MNGINRVKALLISNDTAVSDAMRRLADTAGIDLKVVKPTQNVTSCIVDERPDVVFAQLDNLTVQSGGVSEGRFPLTETPPTVAFSRDASVAEAVDALRAGAVDYMPDVPRKAHTLRRIVARLLRSRSTQRGSSHLCRGCVPFKGFVTRDQRLLAICRTLRRLANSDCIVVLRGEKGTGKDLLARRLHESSYRCLSPFVRLCPDGSAGRREKRDLGGREGTLFIEVGNGADPRELRKLLGRQRFGSTGSGGRPRGAVRAVLAGTEPMDDDWIDVLEEGGCGGRMAPVKVDLPPLRARAGDIPLLSQLFLSRLRQRRKCRAKAIAPGAQRALVEYHWPDNVDGLRKAVRWAVRNAPGARVLSRARLPDFVTEAAGEEREDRGLLGDL